MNDHLNELSLDTICGALSEIIGIPAPEKAAAPAEALVNFAMQAFQGKHADRIFMYNPDAIAQWIYEKYPAFFTEVKERTGIEMPFRSVMPSVTPVCFGTMYTGAQPEVHGILKYERPIIRIDTFFDALIRAGKKPAIVANSACSLAKIYLERDMDYYFFDNVSQVNAKTAELILEDKYDVLIVYNGNYDSTMHKNGPEAPISLGALKANVETFALFSTMIQNHWQHHNTLMGFAMDHGCHEIDDQCGSHGLDMPEDLNITHFYGAYPAK